jgi:hypothetical protein
MLPSWDFRVIPDALLSFVRHLQTRVPCRLSGGAALSGLHLHHRLSHDIDLFFDVQEDVRFATRAAADLAANEGGSLVLVRDGGSFVRGQLTLGKHTLDLDLAHEPSKPLQPRDIIDDVTVDSLSDLHANKITCLLSRTEPRDLVDLFFLDKKGLTTENALPGALQKDAGIDPAILAFLLKDFPTSPLPIMIEEFSVNDLVNYRRTLVDRLRVLTFPAT